MTALPRRWIDAVLAVPLAYKLVAASVAVAALVAGADGRSRIRVELPAAADDAAVARAAAAG